MLKKILICFLEIKHPVVNRVTMNNKVLREKKDKKEISKNIK